MKAIKAFTLIELTIVLAIISVLIASTIQLGVKKRDDTWKKIGENLNNFVMFARQEAIIKRKIHQLVFLSDIKGVSSIKLMKEEDNPEHPGKKIYKEVSSSYLDSVYKFPTTIMIHKIFINGKVPEEDNFLKGIASYIVIDGMMQDISLQLSRQKDGEKGTFILNPFIGKFDFNEGYIKP